MAAEKKFAFQLAAGLATNVLTESKYVKAGYIVVATTAERDALVTGDQEILIAGSPVYVSGEGKTYRFVPNADGHTGTWKDDQATSGSFAYRGEVTYKEDLPTTALEGDIYKVLKTKDPAGVEPDYADGHNYFAHMEDDPDNPGTQKLVWKLMSGVDADAYVNDEGCTVAVGGIAKGTTFEEAEGWTLQRLMDAMLYPYVAFTFESAVSDDAATTYEFGHTVEVSKIKANYTRGSKAMTKINVGDTAAGEEYLTSESVASSGTFVSLTNNITLDGTADKTFYVQLTDGTTTLSKELKVTFTKSIYYTMTTDTTVPTTGTKGNNVNLSVAQDNYVWFFGPDNSKKQIQQYITGEWNNVTTTEAGTVEFTNAEGSKLTYYAYRTNKLNVGPYQMRLN